MNPARRSLAHGSDPLVAYIEAWLTQLLMETCWIAQFDVGSCVDVLVRTCPYYRGLHVNLYDLLFPHESELESFSDSSMNMPCSRCYNRQHVGCNRSM